MQKRCFRSAAIAEPLEGRRLLSTLPSGFTETRIANALFTPTALTMAPDGRVFFTQISGEVRLIKNNALQAGNVLTVNEVNTSEQGLLGITLDPNFGAPGGASDYIYVYYAVGTPTIHNRVSRFLLNGDAAGAEQPIIDLPTNIDDYHQGGALNFGPDGKLYVSVGDMGNSATSQSLTATTGKILRFNSDGSIPTDNPFFAQTTGIYRSIWARGLRNPFTTARQPGSGGAFYINDVGENSFEEINLGAAGANYGWPTTEGTFNQASFPTLTNPISTYSHSVGQCIVGGAFYQGSSNTFPAQYQGKYFFGDFVQGWIKYMDPATKVVSNFATGAQFINNIALAPDGALWYIRGGDTQSGGANVGEIYRIQSTTLSPPVIAQQPQSQTVPVGESVTFDVSATGTSPFTYQWQRNSVNIPGATSASYTLNSVSVANDNGALFRCVVTNSVNSATSNAATLTVTTNTRPTPVITTPIVGETYGGGDVIQFAGVATDAQDGALGGSKFTWRVDFHHDTHAHPFIAPTTGSTSGQFTAATAGEVSPNVWYRITLTVVDSGGLTQTVTRDVLPRKANLTLKTNIAGLALSFDNQPVASLPSVTQGVEGIARTIDAALTQVVGGVTYQFVAWTDGGAANHTIDFPSADQTLTAYYKRVPTTTAYLSDLSWTGTPTNGWGPVERDRSNGENGATDGATIKLNGVTYTKGLGTHAASSITYSFAAGTYARFQSDIGIDDEITSGGSVVFQVFNGTSSLYDSGTMTATTATKSIDIAVPASATSLRFVVADGGNGNTNDHADWAGARFTFAGAAPLTINGTSAADNWIVQMTSDRSAVQIFRDQAVIQTVPIGTYDTINFIGLGSQDQLYISLLNGPIVGVDVISFDGGTTVNPLEFDKIGVLGRSAADTVDVSGSGVFIGSVAFLYSNLERFGISEGTGSDTFNFNATTNLEISLFSDIGAHATLAFNHGQNALDVNAGLTSFTTVRVNNDATLNVLATQHMGSLNVTGNAKVVLAHTTGRLLDVTGPLSITGNAAIDLSDANLISASGPGRGAIESYLRSGAIFSTAADAANNTALGLLTGDEYFNSSGGNDFAGKVVNGSDILLKYTYFGDVDFNGQVDVSDYNLIDFGFSSHLSGWANGDVDGNGSVDASDYNLIDFAFATQSVIL